MDGLDNISQINSRINAERAENVLFESLMAQAAQGNPKATMAAIEIKKNPQNMNSILEKFYTPEGDDMTPEEAALAQAGQQQAGPQAGPPPGLQQVLAQVAAQRGGGQGG